MSPLSKRRHAQVFDIIHTVHSMHKGGLNIRTSGMANVINGLESFSDWDRSHLGAGSRPAQRAESPRPVSVRNGVEKGDCRGEAESEAGLTTFRQILLFRTSPWLASLRF